MQSGHGHGSWDAIQWMYHPLSRDMRQQHRPLELRRDGDCKRKLGSLVKICLETVPDQEYIREAFLTPVGMNDCFVELKIAMGHEGYRRGIQNIV